MGVGAEAIVPSPSASRASAQRPLGWQPKASQRQPRVSNVAPKMNQAQQSMMYHGYLKMSRQTGKKVNTPAAATMTPPKRIPVMPHWHSHTMVAAGEEVCAGDLRCA